VRQQIAQQQSEIAAAAANAERARAQLREAEPDLRDFACSTTASHSVLVMKGSHRETAYRTDRRPD
jgi:hypothetical protein